MNVIKEQIKNAPVYIVYKELEEAKKNGCIFFYHGLTSCKDDNIKEYFELARDGFLVVGIDNVYHGERKHPEFETLFDDNNPMRRQHMLDAVVATATEISELIDELTLRGWIVDEKIGVMGISMGAHITYTAITKDLRIKAAAPIVGSPKYIFERPESPHLHLDKFDKIYLLSQTGGIDEVVPPNNAREFHQRLADVYSDGRFKYVEYSKSGHGLLEEDWKICMTNLKEWFHKYL